MIAKDCQFGVIFGGQQFILLAMVDEHRNGRLVHQMRCSNILPTIPAPGSSLPGAFQITIAAPLGPKHAFFNARGINYGLLQIIPEERPPTREAAKKGKSISESSRKGKGRMQTTQASSGTSRVSYCSVWHYYSSRGMSDNGLASSSELLWLPRIQALVHEGSKYHSYSSFYIICPFSYSFLLKDKSKSVPRPSPGDATGELVLSNTIGGSFSGAIIDADLHQSGEAMQIVAKSYDPDTKALQENESEPDDTKRNARSSHRRRPSLSTRCRGRTQLSSAPKRRQGICFFGVRSKLTIASRTHLLVLGSTAPCGGPIILAIKQALSS